MKGNLLRTNLSREDAFFQILFGFLPGFFSWGLLLGMVYFSFKKPLIGAGISLAFSLYWIVKVCYLIIFVRQAQKRIVVDKEHADWRARAHGLADVDQYLRAIYYASPPEKNTPEDQSLSLHKDEIRDLRKVKDMPPKYELMHHCVIVALDDLEHGGFDACFESLRMGSFPAKKVMLFFVVEENLIEQLKSYVDGIDDEYKKSFYAIKVVGGSRGAAPNRLNKAHLINQAAGLASVFFQKQGIPSDCVIVSCFDRPCALDSEYLSSLTYFYMVNPYRSKVSFAPLPIFSEELSRIDPFLRGYEMGSSFLEVADSTLPMLSKRFYGNSIGLDLLLRLGMFAEDVVSYAQCFSIMACGNYSQVHEVVSLPIRFAADVAPGAGQIKTAATIARRNHDSACSVEGISYYMRLFLKSKDVPYLAKAKFFIQFIENSVVSALWPFLLSALGWLPLIFISRDFSRPMFYFCIDQTRLLLIMLSITGFIISVYAVTTLASNSKNKENPSEILRSLPIVIPGIILGFFSRAITGLKIQTSYMLGRYFKI
jgi:hypothetical protein